MQLNIPLYVTLANLSAHVKRLTNENQPLSESEINVLLILRGVLIQNNLGQSELRASLERLLKRQANSKNSEESATPNFPLPKSSSIQTYSSPTELDKRIAFDLATLANLQQQRQQRPRKKVAVEVEFN